MPKTPENRRPNRAERRLKADIRAIERESHGKKARKRRKCDPNAVLARLSGGNGAPERVLTWHRRDPMPVNAKTEPKTLSRCANSRDTGPSAIDAAGYDPEIIPGRVSGAVRKRGASLDRDLNPTRRPARRIKIR